MQFIQVIMRNLKLSFAVLRAHKQENEVSTESVGFGALGFPQRKDFLLTLLPSVH